MCRHVHGLAGLTRAVRVLRRSGGATGEDIIGPVEGRGLIAAQFALEGQHFGAGREGSVGEVVVLAPARIGGDFARFLVRNGRVIVPAAGDGMHEG